jgi:hypothetical protein
MRSRFHAAVVFTLIACYAIYCNGLGLTVEAGWELITQILPGGLPKNQPGQKPGSYG